jgi:hypothetical protein
MIHSPLSISVINIESDCFFYAGLPNEPYALGDVEMTILMIGVAAVRTWSFAGNWILLEEFSMMIGGKEPSASIVLCYRAPARGRRATEM